MARACVLSRFVSKVLSAAVFAAGAMAASPASAVTILNHSFENPVVPSGGLPAIPLITDWERAGVEVINPAVPGVPLIEVGVFLNQPVGQLGHLSGIDGNQAAFLASTTTHSATQWLSETFDAGAKYEMKALFAVSFFSPSSTDRLFMELLARDGSNTVSTVGALEVDVAGKGLNAASFVELGFETTAGAGVAGQTVGVRFRAVGAQGGYWDVDNVRLTETLPPPNPGTVPEPATLGVAMLALAGVAMRRRR